MPVDTWWRFWSLDAWKAWWGRRPSWKEYRAEDKMLSSAISKEESERAAASIELKSLDQRMAWAREVAPRELPVKTARSEQGLAFVTGVTLLELRKRDGNSVWTPVDTGSVYFTHKQAIFSGSRDVKFRYDKLKSREITESGLHLSVSSRLKSHILSGPAEKIATLIIASEAFANGEQPTDPFAERSGSLAGLISDLGMHIDELGSKRASLVAPPRPISPVWVPLAGILLVGLVASAMTQPSAPTSIAAIPTSTTQPGSSTTEDLSTSTSITSTSTLATTTSSLPAVPQAAVIFAAPIAGESGDPGAPLVTGSEVVIVQSITDGDTLRVVFADGTSEPIRLIGINSPESNECWAAESSLALARLAPPGSSVGLTSDVSDRDQFDRLLRYLWVGTFSVNEELVRRGAAISRKYPPDIAMAPRFDAAQDAASETNLGLWASDACGPAADASLAISDLMYDAPGNDNENLNEEWIRIRNAGANLVDMTGWGIKDESASNRYLFPIGFVLAPGESVTIYSGCGTDFGTDLYWCSVGSAIWNNDGDTAFLTDPNGNTHRSRTYAPATTTTTSPPTTTTQQRSSTTAGGGGGNCHPSYPDVCIPPPPPDLDCGEITFRRFRVVGSDPHGFDRDKDGIGCES